MHGLRFSSMLALVLLAGAAIAAPAESDDARLIQIKDASGALKTEWVAAAALNYLAENRGNIDRTTDELTGVSSTALDAITRVNRGPGFLDVTGFKEEGAPSKRSLTKRAYAAPSPSKYPFLQSTYFGQVDADGLYDIVDTLSNNYTTRAYRSTNARAPALWIQQQFQASLGSSNVQLIENSFNQPNVIAKIPGKNSTESVILAAHLDSTVGSASSSSRAPGADDDASGIAVLLQTAKILAANTYQGSRTIEFHAYAGEEGGLLGSQTVARKYASSGASVAAMLQMDMVAYQTRSKPVLTVLTDTDSSLVAWSQQLLKAYLSSDSIYTSSCGYACSDHFSWEDQGYPAVSIDESGPNDAYLNPYYHSSRDTIDKLDFTKAAEFVKMALAFSVELAA
ncbi:hypothetical protein GGG16DRAFT_99136 [Schizophyllum commune]